MPRLPQPGGDDGQWGEILNDYLSQSHEANGTLKTDTVGSGQLQSGAVTNSIIADATVQESKLSSAVQTKLNDTTIADGAVTTAKLADGAVTTTKLNGLGSANGIASLDSAAKLPEAQVPTRLSASELTTTIASGVGTILTTTPAATSSTGYLSLKGTTPGSVPVVKASGDGRAAVWEMIHNDSTGYLFHLLSGSSMSHNAAIIALGVDNDGIGLLVPNKKDGRGIVGDQRSTVTNPLGYWLHATQQSAAAPLVRLEMNADNSADVLQLIAFGTPGTGQRLLYASDPAGEAGRIRADDGRLIWQRDVRVQNKSSGEVLNYLIASTSSSANSSNTRKAYHGASDDVFFGATGSAGIYYPFKLAHSSSSFAIQTAPNLTSADPLEPKPSEVSTWTSQISMSASAGLTLAVAAGKVGFFGVTPVVRPAAVADATDAATAITQLNALLSRLRTIGLIT